VHFRYLDDGQACRVNVLDVVSGESRMVHSTTDVLLEAPNWTDQGQLLLNGEGKLWALPADGSAPPRPVEIDGIPPINNDHVLAPDHTSIYISATVDWQIYSAPTSGGSARRVTQPEGGVLRFLHGVSPDGGTLAYVSLRGVGRESMWSNVHLVGIDRRGDIALTDDEFPDDGPEFSPDGEWIYFNTERFSRQPGHAQITRIRTDGSQIEQLTFDERVNWFPHLDPSNDHAVYLSFPPGTQGHPANLPVELRLVTHGDWRRPTTVARLTGGQGTINVNSWAPGGRYFAYVDYPTISQESD